MRQIPPKPSRRSAIEAFMVMEVMHAAANREHAGEKVFHMEVGQPGASAPPAIVQAAHAALADGQLGYTEAFGNRALRKRIATYYAEAHKVEVPMERVVITTGSSGGFNLAFIAAFDVGDRIAVPAPGYPAYRNLASALGLEVVEVPVNADTGFVLTPATLERIHAEKPLAGVLIASPANPSGTIMSPAALKALIEAADDLGITFISDEIYHRLVYSGTAATALEFSNDAIVVNSFSKYYCMTGWRVGWMVLPDTLLRPVERISQNLYICAPNISQRAALAAFDATADLDRIRDGYAASRRLLLDRLPKIGFEDLFPVDGAFYVYASIRRFANDSLAFTSRMLAEAGVAATPGHDFDRERGANYVRFSFAGTQADVAEAVDRLSHWLR